MAHGFRLQLALQSAWNSLHVTMVCSFHPKGLQACTGHTQARGSIQPLAGLQEPGDHRMTTLLAALPAPTRVHVGPVAPAEPAPPAAIQGQEAPPYLKRQGFIPRVPRDFFGGGEGRQQAGLSACTHRCHNHAQAVASWRGSWRVCCARRCLS